MQFVGTGESGHSLLFDTVPDVGGQDSAVRPVETVVMALGGCTGMDVISLLRKMRQNFTGFEIQLKAERAQEHPKVLKNVSLTYRVWGDVEEDKFKKAIDLSLEKYCGVSNTIKPKVEIDNEYQVNPIEK